MMLSLHHVVLKEFTLRPRGTVWARNRSLLVFFVPRRQSISTDWQARADFRNGSKPVLGGRLSNVRFATNNGRIGGRIIGGEGGHPSTIVLGSVSAAKMPARSVMSPAHQAAKAVTVIS
jgi:hypothetical protein